MSFLRVGKAATVAERDFNLRVFRVEIVFQSVEVSATFPMAHRKVVEQAVSAGLRRGGRHFRLRQNPFQTRDGQSAHILDAVMARHYHVHTRQTAHRSDIDDIVLCLGIAKPRRHQMFDAVNGRRSHCRLLIRLGDAQIESGKTLVLTRNVDARLQIRVVDGETLNNLHNLIES